MKKIGILIMTLIMIIAMSTTSFAFGISASQAEKTALKSAHLSKSKVRSLEVEKDDNRASEQSDRIESFNPDVPAVASL